MLDNFAEKLEMATKVTVLCGAVGAVTSMGALVIDSKENPPQVYIGDDGHSGVIPSCKQDMLAIGTMASTTLAVSAAMFGRVLRKEYEKEQEATKKAIMAAKQHSR